MASISPILLESIERSRRRLWTVCYRMTGRTSDADDLCQDAIARAIERGDLETLGALLLDDVWGVVDGGGMVRAASRPTAGRRVIARRFANAWRTLGTIPLAAELRRLNGELAVIVRIRAAGLPIAVIHCETHDGRIAALRIDRDPRRLGAFAAN